MKRFVPVVAAWILAAATLESAPAPTSTLLAFPGAEGFGRFATGGRGGAVYHVTHLEDSGPGSFRDAVSQPGRTVVFDASGVIRIRKRITVAPRITIAGQTAPAEGVTVYGNGISFSGANDAIVRHIRFRMGQQGDSGRDAVTIASGGNMMFDHVSISWGRDENFSVSGAVTNITVQNCIIAQGLHPHSAGGLIQTEGGVSILRTLYVDNHTRNPKVKGVNQYVNNVVYNWGGGGCYILGDSAGPSRANVMNNYFINGPSTGNADAFSRGNLNFRIFAADNFQDSDRDGVLNGRLIPKESYGVVAWNDKPFDYPPVSMLSPAQAFNAVIAEAGASLRRDAVDRRLIAEVMSFGKSGRIIANESDMDFRMTGEPAGGVAREDSDRDGMPDSWELAAGLDPKNPEDRNRIAANGYTELERYLHWLAEPRSSVGSTGHN